MNYLTEYEREAFVVLASPTATSTEVHKALDELMRAITDRSYYAERCDQRIEELTTEVNKLRQVTR